MLGHLTDGSSKDEYDSEEHVIGKIGSFNDQYHT